MESENYMLKNFIPIWIKEPILVYLKDIKNNTKKIAFYHAYCNYIENKHINGLKAEKAYKLLHKSIYDQLILRYDYILANNYNENNETIKKIWIFWWQGYDQAPKIVKKCIESVKKNSGSFKVIIIDRTNYQNYVCLPNYIIDKLNKGIISITHFSDILRMNLIAEHGGYWMDATIYCTKNIENSLKERSIFTGRNPGKDKTNISNWNWTGYSIYGKKGNPLFCLARDFFNEYWKNENYLIDYYLIDYVIKMIYENNPIVKDMIDCIENNNQNQTNLNLNFNLEYSYQKYYSLMNDENTWMYKITWKTKYDLFTKNGKPTIYNHWINEEN